MCCWAPLLVYVVGPGTGACAATAASSAAVDKTIRQREVENVWPTIYVRKTLSINSRKTTKR